MTAIRHPAVAGTFYPAERDVLERQLALFLSEAANDAPSPAPPKAIIGPHAGYAYSGAVAARAYARLAAAREDQPRGADRAVALRGVPRPRGGYRRGVGHAERHRGARHRGDRQAARAAHGGELDAAYQREHALEVHVPFLQHVLGEFRLVPIVAGDAPPEAVAAVFDALWGGPETLIVVSTDLSHYLDYAACRRLDQSTAEAIERFDIDALGPAEACGRVPMRGLLLAARQRGMAIERLDLRNSGDTAGPRDRVVGYGAWALYEGAPPDAERAAVEALGPTLIDLVRRSILFGLDTGQPPNVATDGSLAPLLAAPGAAFVTLRRHGALRGCIGSAVATRPLIVDVVQHTFNSAFRDWRFPRLDWLELAGLSLSVSVLTPPSPMRFDGEADLLAQLRPGVDGLIIEDLGRRSLFLPSVWEELPDRRHFLMALKLKAGLRAEHFSPGFRAQRFRSIEVKGAMEAGDGVVDGRLGWTVVGGSTSREGRRRRPKV